MHRVKKLQTFRETLEAVGTSGDSLGCEICKPAVGSILASLNNRHVMAPDMHALQDTNDRFLGNIQRNGTCVCPFADPCADPLSQLLGRPACGRGRDPARASHRHRSDRQGLWPVHQDRPWSTLRPSLTFVQTGGQRLDLFGAQRAGPCKSHVSPADCVDLPAIWKRLNDAGMESGHAYGKSLRTVKVRRQR